MLVWLASYPRSGNHLLRTILKRCFDLGSYEIYQSADRPVDLEWSDIVGARRFDDVGTDAFLNRARSSPELFLVKTHEPVPDSDKCIYIVRDARAALVSFQRFLAEVEGQSVTLSHLITGKHWPGKWQDHVRRFGARHRKNTLVLRYEELASGNPPLDKIAAFLGVSARRKFDVEFSNLRQINPKIFATGSNQPGIDIVQRDHSEEFWRNCGPAMQALGYTSKVGKRRVVDGKKIFFLHLPKCAGSSIWATLNELVGKENVLHVSSVERLRQFENMDAAERNAFRVVGGHYSLGMYKRYLDLSQYFCIATFRDPVQRIVSEYHYAARNPRHSHHAEISRLSLTEFIQRQENPLTSLICGVDADAAATLETIRQVFDECAFVEDLDHLVATLCRTLQRPARPAPHVNKGPLSRPPDVTAEQLELIRKHHSTDLELYRLLKDLPVAERTVRAAAASRASAELSPTAAAGAEHPVFYVVTPSFNRAKYIDETIRSVIGQAGKFSIHYHVQDGGSTDATMEIVRRWQSLVETGNLKPNCIDVRMTSDSRPDRGMYDAIATGFRLLAPQPIDLMTWINSDDRLAPNSMHAVAAAFGDLKGARLIGGRRALIDGQGNLRKTSDLITFPQRALAAGLHDGRHLPFVMQEGTYWRASLFDEVGGLDTSFKLAGDWDLWRRFAAVTEYIPINTITAYHRRHPGQLTESLAGYHREIDEHIGAAAAARRATYQEYLRAWRPNQNVSIPGFSARASVKATSGRWVFSDWTPPTPTARRTAQAAHSASGTAVPASRSGMPG